MAFEPLLSKCACCPSSNTPSRRGFSPRTPRRYSATIAATVRFLQGRDPSLAHRIASRHYLPEGPRFEQHAEDALDWAFGALGLQDRAKHIATLYLNDIADVIREGIDPRFEFVRYAEALAASQPSFDQLHAALSAPHNLVDSRLHALTLETLAQHRPTLRSDHCALSRQRLRRFSHRAIHQADPALRGHGVRRWLLQH